MAKLHIAIAYSYVGDTTINIPDKLLKGLSEEEALRVAHNYAHDHIDKIPFAENAKRIPNTETFTVDDCYFE